MEEESTVLLYVILILYVIVDRSVSFDSCLDRKMLGNMPGEVPLLVMYLRVHW